MIRTQIQLSEPQMQQLRALAARRGVSIAALIREGTEMVLKSGSATNDIERRRRAIAVTGLFHSGKGDLAAEHDRYLAEAYSQ